MIAVGLLPQGIHCVRTDGAWIWCEVCRRCLIEGSVVRLASQRASGCAIAMLARVEVEVNAWALSDTSMVCGRRRILARQSSTIRAAYDAQPPRCRNLVVVDAADSFHDGSIIDFTSIDNVNALDSNEEE